MSHPKQCPKCGQVNAAENTICVICQTRLIATAAPATPQQRPYVQQTAASKREREEIIQMYMRWSQYTYSCGFVPLLLGGAMFLGALSTSLLGGCVSGAIALIGLAMVYYGPRVGEGLQAGETWPYDIIIKAHLFLYGILILMILGVLVLFISESSSSEMSPWVGIAILGTPLIVGLVINWYAHQAFEVVIGRRSGKIRRFGPLSTTFGRPAGVKVYAYLMGLYAVIMAYALIASARSHMDDHPGDWGGLITLAITGLVLLIVFIALGIGVWQKRAWGRQLALLFHAAIGVFTIYAVFSGNVSDSVAPFIGGFFINLAVWNWFNTHADYFDR